MKMKMTRTRKTRKKMNRMMMRRMRMTMYPQKVDDDITPMITRYQKRRQYQDLTKMVRVSVKNNE